MYQKLVIFGDKSVKAEISSSLRVEKNHLISG